MGIFYALYYNLYLDKMKTVLDAFSLIKINNIANKIFYPFLKPFYKIMHSILIMYTLIYFHIFFFSFMNYFIYKLFYFF